MKRKTIKNLMSKSRIVYVKVHSEWAAQAFFALAEYEGFRISEELKPKHHLTFILNDDMTISCPEYHSWAGAMCFHNAKYKDGKKIVRIDFEEMLYRV